MVVMVVFGFQGLAQLSTRENDDVKIKLGARPAARDMALTFGYDVANDYKANLYGGNVLQGGDILNFKYYLSPKTALRLGINLSKQTYNSSGTFSDTIPGISIPGSEYKEKKSAREYVLVPGIEHHFLESNIFDVFAGADLYLGFGRKLYQNDMSNKSGDASNYKMTMGTTVVGVGGVVGFNVFVAQLPVSIGIEYGLNLKWELGKKSKVTEEQTFNGQTASAEYQRFYDWPEKVEDFSKPYPPTAYFESLSNNYFGMGTNQNVRIVLNIYFGK